ncbi:MAG: TRAP transporter substrate-binding protein DctP [Clostridiales Family XIII bacterium]|jgi:TRAP-type C4-dicarboxylate transport system substrate-binding protein|nr:TRAP transporter substrate-binding protein DctP [Clostridiales Family XIII bacterium]
MGRLVRVFVSIGIQERRRHCCEKEGKIKIIVRDVNAVGLSDAFAFCMRGGGDKSNSDAGSQDSQASDAVGGGGETFTLSFSSVNPAEDNKYKVVAQAWFNYLEQESGGRIKVNAYFNSQAASPAEQLIAAKNGVVDIGEFYSTYFAENYPLNELFTLPFQFPFPDGMAWSRTYNAMLEKYPEFRAEFEDKGVVLLFMHGDGVEQLWSKQPVRTMDDLLGMIVNCGSTTDVRLYQLLGANTEMLNSMETFDALSKGVVDATSFCFAGGVVTGVYEACNYVTETNGAHSAWAFVMNKDTYDSLGDLQYLFQPDRLAEFAELFGYQFAMDELLVQERVKADPNYEYITLSDEDMAKFREAAQPFVGDWIQKVTDLGYDGQAMYDDFASFVRQYSDFETAIKGKKDRLVALGAEVPEGWY